MKFISTGIVLGLILVGAESVLAAPRPNQSRGKGRCRGKNCKNPKNKKPGKVMTTTIAGGAVLTTTLPAPDATGTAGDISSAIASGDIPVATGSPDVSGGDNGDLPISTDTASGGAPTETGNSSEAPTATDSSQTPEETGNNSNNNGGNNNGGNNNGGNNNGGNNNGGNSNGGDNNGSDNNGDNNNGGNNNDGNNNGGNNNNGDNNGGNNNGGNNNGGNNGGNNGNGGDKALTLDPANVQSNSATTGQETNADPAQADSLTDSANFINFCTGKTITNGLQVKGGSCNGIVMGDIPSATNMVSSIITFPGTGEDIAADTEFDIKVKVLNLVAGSFTNPAVTYYAAPQSLKNGKVVGHTHVTVQKIESLNPTNPPDPAVFEFFKGINDDGDGNGNLKATVPGLPAGFYRVCTMSSSSNHQPVLMPVAQRGAQDDCQKFSVGQGGNGGNRNRGN